MTKNEKQGALYLQKDGRIELIHGDDVEAHKADGWKEPEGKRGNGQAYNLPEDQGARDAAASFAKEADNEAADKQAKEAKASKK